MRIRKTKSVFICVICVVLLEGTVHANTVSTASLRDEVNDFLGRELAVHLGAIKTLDPPPDRVLGVPTTGEFSWGTFMRSLAAYAETTGNRELAGRDIAKWVGQIGLIESRAGSKAFSQLYAALALRHFGRDLKTNPLWQSLTAEEQKAWRSLLNPERFYDPKANKVINLPDNYLGVAARIASISYQLGISTDRAFLDKLLDRAAVQFTEGKLYADDAPPTGRYDRYSNEYARYIWEAAEMAGRKDLLDKVRPSLIVQMRLWWDIVSEDGYGYNWGRSQGVVSYLDTPEIAGFLASHPEFRPAPLADIAALYYQAWNYLQRDYRTNAHLLSIFAFGRGNYAYISREREWQQTTGFFGKLANSHTPIVTALEKEGVQTFPVVPALRPVARFEFFRKSPERAAGVWVVRDGLLRFALPITTGPKPGMSDYLPAPHGLPGFAAPVEQIYPALTPFIELADGRTAVAGDGADVIEPAADGRSLRARWSKWAIVGKPSGKVEDIGLTSKVVWRIENGTLTREETLSSKQTVTIRRWRFSLPTSHLALDWNLLKSPRGQVRFISSKGSLDEEHSANFQYDGLFQPSGDAPIGRGVHGAIPLHLMLEAKDITVQPRKPLKFRIDLTPHEGKPKP